MDPEAQRKLDALYEQCIGRRAVLQRQGKPSLGSVERRPRRYAQTHGPVQTVRHPTAVNLGDGWFYVLPPGIGSADEEEHKTLVAAKERLASVSGTKPAPQIVIEEAAASKDKGKS